MYMQFWKISAGCRESVNGTIICYITTLVIVRAKILYTIAKQRFYFYNAAAAFICRPNLSRKWVAKMI